MVLTRRRGIGCLLAIAMTVGVAGAATSTSAEKKAPALNGKKASSSKAPAGKTAKDASKKAPAAVGQNEADRDIDANAFDQVLLSKLVFDYTNVERRRAGLTEFQENSVLSNSATAHSQDMASRGYFAHKSKGLLNRTDPRDRVQSLGYDPGMVAENIAMVPTYNGQTIQTYPGSAPVVTTDFNTYRQLAETAMKEWMNSPGHRENILNPRLTTLGVGVAIGINKNVPYVYLTQNFGG